MVVVYAPNSIYLGQMVGSNPIAICRAKYNVILVAPSCSSFLHPFSLTVFSLL
jgi:hypothetical protein